MNELIKSLEDLIEKKSENQELKVELSSLVKMLKTGFESTTKGMEKIPKVFASNDEKKIAAFYDMFGTQIQALKISGNFDKFKEYLKVSFGINIEFTSDTSPNLYYVKKEKKRQKFNDLFTGYYLVDVPKEPKEAVEKILNSLDALTKEFTTESNLIKDTLKEIIESNSDKHESSTVKTVDKILTSARIKSLKIEDVATETEDKLNLQMLGIDIILKRDEPTLAEEE